MFQQDDDSNHCSKQTKDFFKENQDPVFSWPPQSSDLKPPFG